MRNLSVGVKARILIVEDDVDMAETCRRIFKKAGLEADAAYGAEEALSRLAASPTYDIVLTDLRMPRMDGAQLLQKIKKNHPKIDVVMMTGYGTIQNAIQAMKIGASDYITKPFDKDELLRAVNQILESHKLRDEVQRLRGELKQTFSYPNLIGRGASMRRVFSMIEAASRNESSVLVVGESGTGKEVVARAIHYNGLRAEGPFVPVNCGAIPHGLIESELFGHRRGAFTGASATTLGLVRSADKGTLFLDEFADMPIETQAKLLRVIQERKVRPVGAIEEVQVDVRFIAATNRDIEEAVSGGLLRQDLFYRLAVIRIELPALRERAEDIPFLVQHFIEKYQKVFPERIGGFEAAALDALRECEWPGNVRELENLVESLFAIGLKGKVTLEDLPEPIRESAQPLRRATRELPSALSDAERETVVGALKACNGNKSKAAEMLRISRARLYRKIREYRLEEFRK